MKTVFFTIVFLLFPTLIYAKAPDPTTIRSVTFYDFAATSSQRLDHLRQSLPQIKSTGFNTVWLVSPWLHYNPRPMATPPAYDNSEFDILKQTLELLKTNNMQAILGLDYLGQYWAPEGIDDCEWIREPTQYQAFVTYTTEFLTRIQDYSDMIYILVFSENAVPCSLDPHRGADNDKAHQGVQLFQQTLGNIPAQLPAELRNKFSFGYHDFILIDRHWDRGESPIAHPNPFDFVSMVGYKMEDTQMESLPDDQIAAILETRAQRFRTLFPTMPLIVGEFGATACGNKDDNQARVISAVIQWTKQKGYGFNLWGWKPGPGSEECTNPVFGGLAITNPDGSAKPAVAQIRELLFHDIQSQINALPQSGGEIVLPAGTYTLSTVGGSAEVFPNGSPIPSAIVIHKPNVTLRGQGSQTVLQLAPNTKMRAISITSNNVTIKNLVIDGNKENRNGSVPWPSGDVVDALLYGSQTATNVTIENVEVRNGIEDGIGFWKSENVVVKNSYSHDNGTIQAGGAGISLSGVTNGQATDNRIENNTATGIWSAFDANTITISQNMIKNNRSGGITIGGGTIDDGLGPNNTSFTITHNTLEANGAARFASLTIFGSQNGAISQNTFTRSHFDSIQVDGTTEVVSNNWTIQNNTCTITSSQDLGIRILEHAQNVQVRDNRCSPLAGDLNNDNKVDIFDYNLLVASFGNPYTIFDYNQLVANFGKSN